MADLRRFFVDKIEDTVVISDEEFRHAVSVLRIKEGESVILLDNSGYEYFARVDKINKKDLVASVYDKKLSETETTESVTLICGYLKGDKTELVVQKATELGVKKIIVFSSEFSSSFINDNKLARLNKVAVESSKQCKRAIAPKVFYADTLENALSFGQDAQNKLFACEFATENEVNLSALKGSTAIVVGSEGGFSKREYELAKTQNYKTVYLGKRILRAETCSIVLCGLVINALGEF